MSGERISFSTQGRVVIFDIWVLSVNTKDSRGAPRSIAQAIESLPEQETDSGSDLSVLRVTIPGDFVSSDVFYY